MSLKIGKSKHGGGQKKFFKLAKGEGVVGVYRFLPPLGDAADLGVWTKFYRVHYGYKNSEGRMKPFQSCEKLDGKKMVIAEDAAKQRIKMLEAKALEFKAKAKALADAGQPEDPALMENLNSVKELLRRYNMEGKWYMNAINLGGEIGLAKIPHKAKQLLETAIKELEAKGVDPTGVEDGRFFEIIRTGNGNQTVYSVRMHTKTIQHPELGEIQQPVKHALDDAILARLEGETHNLLSLFKAPTSEQVARIVKEGVPAVDEILGKGQNNGAASSGGGSNDGEDDTADNDEVDSVIAEAQNGTKAPAAKSSVDSILNSAPTTTAAAPAPAKQAPAATVTAPVTQPAPVQTTAPAAAAPASAPAAGLKIGKSTVTETAAAVAKTDAAKVQSMSSEDFLNMIEST